MVPCMQATGRCSGRSTPSFCSRKFREAKFTLHSVPARCGKQMSPYSLFPNGSGSKCHPTVCSRTVREANVTLQSVPERFGKQMSPYSLSPDGSGSRSIRCGAGILTYIINTSCGLVLCIPAFVGMTRFGVETGRPVSTGTRRRVGA
ncbi:MAG: hypothetical protein LBL57_08620 [Tannerella sp.]|nr:hypothetical protein [Tannerella sp.]